MADRVLNVSVISPEKILYTGNATYVKIPGSDGLFGVLYNHAPLVSEIDLGILVVTNGTEVTNIYVDGGFAEIKKNTVNILAKSGELASQVNKEEVKKRISEISSKTDKESLLELKRLKTKLVL
jgi:F-type H+-transporting ATPase subunit epsilon